MNQVERLEKAAKLIEERGHAKGVFVNDAGCLCLAGAIILAEGGRIEKRTDEPEACSSPSGPTTRSDFAEIGRRLRRRGFLITDEPSASELAVWNDMPERTKEDVAKLLREGFGWNPWRQLAARLR